MPALLAEPQAGANHAFSIREVDVGIASLLGAVGAVVGVVMQLSAYQRDLPGAAQVEAVFQ